MLAAQNGHLEVVRLLLDKISNVNQDNKVPVCARARPRVLGSKAGPCHPPAGPLP